MATSDEQCLGITLRGERCRNKAKPGSKYCHWHDLPEEERNAISAFCREHWKGITLFFATAFGGSIVDDLYEQLKVLAGVEPPNQEILESLRDLQGRQSHGEKETIREASTHLRKHHDYASLTVLIGSLKLGAIEAEVERLIGRATSRKTAEVDHDNASIALDPEGFGVDPFGTPYYIGGDIWFFREAGSYVCSSYEVTSSRVDESYRLHLLYKEPRMFGPIFRLLDAKGFPLESISLEHPFVTQQRR